MRRIRRLLIILIIIVLVGIGAYYVYENYIKESDEPKVIKKIKKYDYELNNKETKLYKTTFDELDKILSKKNVDYEAYAKTISKLFIIDFYTLDNKMSKNDIGGVQFIKESMRDNFIEQSRGTFYRYVEQKEGRTQKLPVVSKIKSVSVQKTTYMVKDLETTTNKKVKTEPSGTEYEAYNVSITWDYEKDLGYETQANLTLIKDGIKLYIVEMD